MKNLNPYATAWKDEEQAAEYINVTVIRLRQLIKLGKVSCFSIKMYPKHNRKAFTESNLNNYLQEN